MQRSQGDNSGAGPVPSSASWDDEEGTMMNFNEPIVLGASSSNVKPPDAARDSSSSAGARPAALVDPVEEARLLARKKQQELERMHDQASPRSSLSYLLFKSL